MFLHSLAFLQLSKGKKKVNLIQKIIKIIKGEIQDSTANIKKVSQQITEKKKNKEKKERKKERKKEKEKKSIRINSFCN